MEDIAHGVTRVGHDQVTKPPRVDLLCFPNKVCISSFYYPDKKRTFGFFTTSTVWEAQ